MATHGDGTESVPYRKAKLTLCCYKEDGRGGLDEADAIIPYLYRRRVWL